MNFIKPTKIKILGTVIVYFAGVLHGWINAGLFVLLFPDLLSELEGEFAGIQERVGDISVAGGIGASVFSLLVEVTLLYLAVCIIVLLLKKKP